VLALFLLSCAYLPVVLVLLDVKRRERRSYRELLHDEAKPELEAMAREWEARR